MARSRSSKRQTKLSFSPVSSQSRNAYVTYDGSPLKRRRIEEYIQNVARSDGPSSSAFNATQSSQWPINSTPARGTDQELPIYDGEKSENDAGQDLQGSDTSYDSLIIKTPKKKRHNAQKKSAPESSQVFSRPPVISPKRKQTQSSPATDARDVITLFSSDEDSNSKDEDTDDDESPKTPSKTNLFPGKTPQTKTRAESDEDSDAVRPSTQRKPQLKPKQSKGANRSPIRVSDQESDDGEVGDEGEDEDEDEVLPAQSQRRRLTRRSERDARSSRDHDESDDDAPLPPPTQRRKQTIADDSSSGGEAAPSSSKRRSLRQRRSSRRAPVDVTDDDTTGKEDSNASLSDTVHKRRSAHDREQQEEIDEDAEDLKTSTVFRDDATAKAKPSSRDKRRSRLAELKAKRSGRASSPVDLDSDQGDADQGLEAYGDDVVDPLDEDGADLDDWVVEEEDDEDDEDEGDDALTDLHLMRHAQLKLREHWEYIIRWMLTNRLNPLGAADLEDFYKTSLRRVNNECRGLINRLISSAWVPIFVNALKARPDYEEAPITEIKLGDEQGKCSACSRAGHPASFVVRLTGKAYDNKTLEPLKDEDDDGEESYDEEGRQLIDEAREFKLGVYCRSNAMNAHALIHWRMRLKDWIQIYLKQNGYLKSRRIVERESWPISKRAKLVDEIIDGLKEAGTIKALWREFDEKLTSAPNVQGQRAWK